MPPCRARLPRWSPCPSRCCQPLPQRGPVPVLQTCTLPRPSQPKPAPMLHRSPGTLGRPGQPGRRGPACSTGRLLMMRRRPPGMGPPASPVCRSVRRQGDGGAGGAIGAHLLSAARCFGGRRMPPRLLQHAAQRQFYLHSWHPKMTSRMAFHAGLLGAGVAARRARFLS